jgi:hypothetical protein
MGQRDSGAVCVLRLCKRSIYESILVYLKERKKGSIVRMLEDVLQQTFAALHQQAGTVRHSRPCVRPLADAQ